MVRQRSSAFWMACARTARTIMKAVAAKPPADVVCGMKERAFRLPVRFRAFGKQTGFRLRNAAALQNTVFEFFK